jgi:hypothetical protein
MVCRQFEDAGYSLSNRTAILRAGGSKPVRHDYHYRTASTPNRHDFPEIRSGVINYDSMRFI